MIRELLGRFGLRLHTHSQNLNELPGDRLGPKWKHGLAWAWLYDSEERQVGPVARIEWSHGRVDLASTLDLNADERSATWHIAVPGASYFLTMEGLPKSWFQALPFKWRRTQYNYMGLHRSIGFRVFAGSLWLSLWEDTHEWRHDDPIWWKASINFADKLFGKYKHRSEAVEVREVEIPMPEGKYPATVKIEARSWLRPRWPWKPWSRQDIGAHVDIPKGVPIPGKGENSWDCGDDAIYGMSCQANTVEEAIGAVVASALRTRMRYSGRHSWNTVKEHAVADVEVKDSPTV